MTVPAAIKGLEKIEITRQTDNIYQLDHAVIAKQKKILKAFGMNEGSVSEQTEFFEKRMCHYFKQEIMERKLIAIDSILRDEEKKKREEFQDFIAIGGLMLNIAIGLPAINDTIAVIREVFAFWPYNVPIITMENVSLFLWLVFNGFILIKIVKERMLNKVL